MYVYARTAYPDVIVDVTAIQRRPAKKSVGPFVRNAYFRPVPYSCVFVLITALAYIVTVECPSDISPQAWWGWIYPLKRPQSVCVLYAHTFFQVSQEVQLMYLFPSERPTIASGQTHSAFGVQVAGDRPHDISGYSLHA